MVNVQAEQFYRAMYLFQHLQFEKQPNWNVNGAFVKLAVLSCPLPLLRILPICTASINQTVSWYLSWDGRKFPTSVNFINLQLSNNARFEDSEPVKENPTERRHAVSVERVQTFSILFVTGSSTNIVSVLTETIRTSVRPIALNVRINEVTSYSLPSHCIVFLIAQAILI